ncbi:MAG: TlpA family protein disulfide reductase [Flavobacteriaceae bacterium]
MNKNLRLIILTILGVGILYFGSGVVKKLYYTANSENLIQQLPDLELTALDGTKVNLERLSSEKNQLLIYYSSECSHCVDEIRSLKKDRQVIPDVDIYLISIEDPRVTKKFIAKMGLNPEDELNFLSDTKWEFPVMYDIKATPSMFFYNKEHQLVSTHVGTMPAEVIKARFE